MHCVKFLAGYLLIIATVYTYKPIHHDMVPRCENDNTMMCSFRDKFSEKNETTFHKITVIKNYQVNSYSVDGRSFIGDKLINFGIPRFIKYLAKKVVKMYNVYKSEMNFGICVTKYYGTRMHSIFEKQNTLTFKNNTIGTGRNQNVIDAGASIMNLFADFFLVVSGIAQFLSGYILYLPGIIMLISNVFPGINERISSYMHVTSGVGLEIGGYFGIISGVGQLLAGYFQVIPAVVQLIYAFVQPIPGVEALVTIIFLAIIPGVATVIAGIMQIIPGILQLISGYQQIAPGIEQLISTNRAQRDLMEYEESVLTVFASYLQVIPGVAQLISVVNWILQLYNHKINLCSKTFLEKKFWEWIDS